MGLDSPCEGYLNKHCEIPGSQGTWISTYDVPIILPPKYPFWQWAVPFAGMSMVTPGPNGQPITYEGTHGTHQIFIGTSLSPNPLDAVLFDSGTSLICFGNEYRDYMFFQVKVYMDKLGVVCEYAEVADVQTHGAVRIICKTGAQPIEKWPTWRLSAGGLLFDLLPKYFVNDEKHGYTSWTVQYCPERSADGYMQIIVGSVFFNQYAVKFQASGLPDTTSVRMAFKGEGVKRDTRQYLNPETEAHSPGKGVSREHWNSLVTEGFRNGYFTA